MDAMWGIKYVGQMLTGDIVVGVSKSCLGVGVGVIACLSCPTVSVDSDDTRFPIGVTSLVVVLERLLVFRNGRYHRPLDSVSLGGANEEGGVPAADEVTSLLTVDVVEKSVLALSIESIVDERSGGSRSWNWFGSS